LLEVKDVPSWNDSRWLKGLARLPPQQKLQLSESLKDLLSALKACNHPRELKAWKPTRWNVPRAQETMGEWIEYYLGDRDNRARAIVCFDPKEKIVYRVARTAIHEHEALRELVARFNF